MEKLTYTERMILEYIQFKTNHNLPFFQSNETIANAINITKGTAKEYINQLIRGGYLIKTSDEKKRRVLSLSGKEYPRMPWVNMADVNKWGIKKERDEYLKEYESANKWGFQLQAENDILQKKCSDLQQQLDTINKQLMENFVPQFQAQVKRIADLEKFLLDKYGLTKEQVDALLNVGNVPMGQYC